MVEAMPGGQKGGKPHWASGKAAEGAGRGGGLRLVEGPGARGEDRLEEFLAIQEAKAQGAAPSAGGKAPVEPAKGRGQADPGHGPKGGAGDKGLGSKAKGAGPGKGPAPQETKGKGKGRGKAP